VVATMRLGPTAQHEHGTHGARTGMGRAVVALVLGCAVAVVVLLYFALLVGMRVLVVCRTFVIVLVDPKRYGARRCGIASRR